MTPDLILTNARVITLDSVRPFAEAVAVGGESILAVGTPGEIQVMSSSRTQIIDCRGLTLLPGFVDAHCHLLALASTLTGIDCGPDTASSIADLIRVIREQTQKTPPGKWIRGFGYEETSLQESRHPNRHDLDLAASLHPVRLDHRGGHATVLNSLALELAVINRDTPDPVDGIIDREPESGEPTGVFFEMAGFLRERLGASGDMEQREWGIDRLNRKLLKCGITSVQDAGPNNDLARWGTFRGLTDSGRLKSRVTMMADLGRLHEFSKRGLSFGAGDNKLRLGHAKIMVTMTTGDLQPALPELIELVTQAHSFGFPVAIHAVEEQAVLAAAGGLQAALPLPPASLPPDRIEHCSECPPEILEQVVRSGATVVTQPGFIHWSGDRYLEQVEPDMLPHLYPLNEWHWSGVPVAFSSDAPVVEPNPWPGIYAAVTRRARQGRILPQGRSGEARPLSVTDALRMYTMAGAAAEGTASSKGGIAPGKLADLVLVDEDPLVIAAERLKGINAVLTVIGGEVVWENGL